MSNYPNQEFSHRPKAAEGLDGFIDSGTVSGSGDGNMTQFAVFHHGSPCLDNRAVRRLDNGLVALSNIFPKRPDSDDRKPPSQAEAVLFLVALEHAANLRLLAEPKPASRWHRRSRQETEFSVPEKRRREKVMQTQERMVRLGLKVDVSFSLAVSKELITE